MSDNKKLIERLLVFADELEEGPFTSDTQLLRDSASALEEREGQLQEIRAQVEEAKQSSWWDGGCDIADNLLAIDAALHPSPVEGTGCEECDGKGHYTGWPHTTCPTCKGTGKTSDPAPAEAAG